jgi:hypothetical protein
MHKQLLLLALLAIGGWFGMGDAKAACTLQSGSGDTGTWIGCDDQREALAKIQAMLSSMTLAEAKVTCGPSITTFSTRATYNGVKAYSGQFNCNGAASWNNRGQTNFTTNTCSSQAPLVGVFASAASTGGKYCNFGCEFAQTNTRDVELNPGNANAIQIKTVLGATASGLACAPDAATKPPPTSPPSPQCLVVGSSSAGDITQCYDDGKVCVYNGAKKIGCNAPNGTGQNVNGDVAQTDNGQPPTTPAPDGKAWAPVGDTKHTNNDNATGPVTHTTSNWDGSGTPPAPPGGTGQCGGPGKPACPTSPTCGGTGQPACANGNTSNGGGTCGSPPVSAGDPLLAQIAYQSWATRCAVINSGGGADDHGDANGNGQPDWTEDGSALDNTGADLPNTGAVVNPTDDGTGNSLDQTGFGWGTSCPAPVEVEIYGNTVQLAPPALCDWMQAGGWFVLLLSAIRCARMIAGAAS